MHDTAARGVVHALTGCARVGCGIESAAVALRILHVIDSLDPAGGGPPTVVPRLAAAQGSLGHHLAIAAAAADAQRDAIESSLKNIPGIGVVRLERLPPPCCLRALAGDASACAPLVRDADVVHLHGVWSALLLGAARAALAAGVPYVVAPHGMLYPWSLARKRLKKMLGLLLGYRRMLQRAAMIHVLNADERLAMAPLGLRPPMEVIHNGIFPEEFENLPPAGEFRSSVSGLAGRQYVLFLSRLHEGKGLMLLARAFAIVARKHGDAQLVVAGPDAGARAPFEEEIRRCGIVSRTHIVGPLYGRAKLAALRDAACFCLPSEHETFSMAILEALACGVPAVISDQCHFPEVSRFAAGLAVPREPGAVADAICRVLADERLRSDMAESGRRLVREQFTWPAIAARSVELYDSLIGQRAQGGRLDR